MSVLRYTRSDVPSGGIPPETIIDVHVDVRKEKEIERER